MGYLCIYDLMYIVNTRAYSFHEIVMFAMTLFKLLSAYAFGL